MGQHHVSEPVVKPLRQFPGAVRDRDTTLIPLLRLAHPLGRLLAGLAVDGDALASTGAGPGVVAAHPPAISAPSEGAVAVHTTAGDGHQATLSAWSWSWRT